MTPDLHSNPRDPQRDTPLSSGPPQAGRARESVVWEGDAAGTSAPVARGNSPAISTDSKWCPHCDAEYEATLMFCPKDGAVLRGRVATDDLTGQVLADRYRVIRKLGEGAMGQVYLAQHLRMGRTCAIKVMSSALLANAAAIARFDREASNASRISHPGVVSVYDFGEASDGIVFLAMEYVEGVPLTKLLQAEQALPVDRALRIARQIAEALSAAHELGIVHRDLKPDNIMVGRNRDGSDCVKVVDFGISKGVQGPSQTLTMTGLIIGTPAYMSPEQLAGDPVDGRSDIYSLGLVLFHMLTGALPFGAGEDGVRARLISPARRLAEVRPDRPWSSGLQALLDRALAPIASNRYPTADAIALDILPLLEAAKSSARGSTASRARALTLGGGVMIAASATVAALWFWPSANAAAGDAPAPAAPGQASPGLVPERETGTATGVGRDAATDSIERRRNAPPDTARPERATAFVPPPITAADRNPLERPADAAPPAAVSSPPKQATHVAALDSLEQWTSPTTGTTESARRAIRWLPELLPRLTSRDDSVAAHYYVAGAHIALGDAGSACTVLRRIERPGAAHPYLARAIASYLTDPTLDCR